MTTPTFAPWVEPVAQELRETRARIVSIARQPPDEDLWRLPSPLPGWRYRDLLAHLATGDWVCQTVLRTAIAGEQLDMRMFDDLNATNATLVDERRELFVDELIAEVEAEGEETQELLAQLRDEHEGLKPPGAPMSLGEYLRGFPGHDRAHTEQLKVMLENVML